MRTYTLLVIPGDGIGPEITQAALVVLHALTRKRCTFSFQVLYQEAGAGFYRRTGRNAPADLVEQCHRADAVLKGPAGLPDVRLPDGTEAGLLGGLLRPGLDAYANVRPIKLWPGVSAPTVFRPRQIDYVIVRENSEGLYASRGTGVGNEWAMTDTLLMTRRGVERVVRRAFELARRRSGAPADRVRRVTCVDKSNVLRSFAFFRRIFTEVARDYPDIEGDFLYADAAAQALVMDPARFDVLVMENFLGDLLSDLAGGTIGGLGMCPSANIGDQAAYFEPIHGSAPAIAGQGVANPIAQVLSAALLLEHLGEQEAAKSVEAAVWRTLESGTLAIDANGCPAGGTRAATDAIVEQL